MPRASYHPIGIRAWDIQADVVLWCRPSRGWYVVFSTPPGQQTHGTWTWRVSRDQARLLLAMVRP